MLSSESNSAFRDDAEEVERSRLDQRLDHFLVARAQVDRFAELEERCEPPLLLARFEDRFDGAAADAFHRAEAEADVRADHGEGVVRLVDVRRQDADAHLRRLVDELHHEVGAVHFRGHQRGHEVPRVVNLQPRGLVRDERVGDRVRLVEAVARERLDVVEDLVRLLLVVAVRGRAVDELAALRGHDRGVLLAHRLAQQVGVAERVAGHALRDLHDLLLVDDDAVRLLEQLLHDRHEVPRLLRAGLDLDVVVDHAGVERAGAIERVERGEVLELRRPRLAQQVDHAARLELEHALRPPFLEEPEDLGIVERQVVDIDRDALDRLRRLDGVVDHRQRAQAEEVHLEKTHLLDDAPCRTASRFHRGSCGTAARNS